MTVGRDRRTQRASSRNTARLGVCLVAAGLAFIAPPVSAMRQSEAAGTKRVISADLNRVKGPRDMAWQFCVGGSHAGLMLTPANLDQLALLHRELGFRYVRFHGILSDDMHVYSLAGGEPSYDFSRVDALYDSILAIGMKPFVELSFMPHDLASGSQSIFYWKANVAPPRSEQQWAALVTAFVSHLQTRYGAPEVKTWFFEVWNEPNYAGFWPNADFRAYMSLYEASADAIKAVNPDFRVGGPATAEAQLVLPFVQLATDRKLPVDFLSTHAFAVKEKPTSSGAIDLWLAPEVAPVAAQVQRVHAQIVQSSQPQLPLYITEWNSSYSSDDPIHDSYTAAAFVLEQIKRSEGSAAAMSYWSYSDLFEEISPPPAAFYGGFGLLTRDGIPKASYFAYRYLNSLGPVELQNADASSWITSDAGSVQALIWNEVPFTQDSGDRVFYRTARPARASKPVELRLAHLVPGRYDLKLYRTGYDAHDAYTEWLAMGSPKQLDADQITKLKAATSDVPASQQVVQISEAGTYSMGLQLRENDVVFVFMSKVGR